MADSNPGEARNRMRRERDARRLCVLFKGRMTEGVAEELIDEIGSLEEAARFLMTGTEEQVRQRLHESAEYVRRLREDSEKFTLVLSRAKMDCQFACEDCNKMWWKRVPANKQVSKCPSCHRKFDSIPEEHQWGWGEFACGGNTCHNTFKGFGILNRTLSRCYSCGAAARMISVEPPKKREREDRPTRHKHNCNGVNCYRGREFHGCGAFLDTDKPPVCIHPRSRDPTHPVRIHCASNLHISTGSTVDTFLDQGSLQTRSASPAHSLETIPEDYEANRY